MTLPATPPLADTLARLDQAELLQLALRAGAADDAAGAIACLKEAAGRSDANGTTHYLLGAEYAQIGLYDRAADAMEMALAIDPSLALVRLQLGLLWMTRADAARSAQVLAPLDDLAPGDPLAYFGRGLRQLAVDEFDVARRSLQAGIAANTANAPLNADMQRIIDQIDALAPPGEAGQPIDQAELARQLMLSAYNGNTSH